MLWRKGREVPALYHQPRHMQTEASTDMNVVFIQKTVGRKYPLLLPAACHSSYVSVCEYFFIIIIVEALGKRVFPHFSSILVFIFL